MNEKTCAFKKAGLLANSEYDPRTNIESDSLAVCDKYCCELWIEGEPEGTCAIRALALALFRVITAQGV